MIKIGILSHYHNTTNYGGALQAYALCKTLNDMGYESEQVDIDCFAECINLNETASVSKKIIHTVKPLYKVINKIRHHKAKVLKKKLQVAFRNFNEKLIPHSAKQFNSVTIAETIDIYDIFIVGSDQVWNPIWYIEPFFLSFVPKGVPKISYAASISQPILSSKAEQVYKEHLKDFFAISVREKNAVDLIKRITQKEIDYVLDPTLLLNREQWEELTSNRLIHDSYVFCYFLGGDNEIRELAREYAERNKLILVNVKHATGQYHKADINYGDIEIEAPTPNDFLSLIRYADMVFTDSFHASVFSLVFQRQFYVFERCGHKNMGTRITSLMELFETDNRFCNTVDKTTTEYICQQPPIDYIKECKLFEQMKNTSIAFLENNLKEAVKQIKDKYNE